MTLPCGACHPNIGHLVAPHLWRPARLANGRSIPSFAVTRVSRAAVGRSSLWSVCGSRPSGRRRENLTGPQVAASVGEPERGDRPAALLRFVDADVSPVTTQTPARSWSSNSRGPSEGQHRGLVERACLRRAGSRSRGPSPSSTALTRDRWRSSGYYPAPRYTKSASGPSEDGRFAVVPPHVL